MTSENDYYALLGVTRDAAHNDIRKAFHERVRGCHPDLVANLDEDLKRLAEEKMVQLNEAYAVLRNAARRAAYDDRYSKKSRTTAGIRAFSSLSTHCSLIGRSYEHPSDTCG